MASVFIDGRRHDFRMRDISLSGARFEGNIEAPAGTSVLLRLGNNSIMARIMRSTKESFAVRFENSLGRGGACPPHLLGHAGAGDPPGERPPLVRALIRRMFQ